MTIVHGGSDPERAINMAIDLRDAGRGAEAIGLLREALGSNPRNPRLWQTLGVVHRVLEQSAAAIAAFAEAAKLVPGDLKAAYGVAQASLEAGRPAVALFDRACALAPADGSLLIGRAAALIAEGRGAEATAFLDAIVTANPAWGDGQATLARIRWMMGDVDGFTQGYERALAAAPNHGGLWIALLNTLLHAERYDRAAEVLASARQAIGAHSALMPAEAICASELGEDARADVLFAQLAPQADVTLVERHMRHLLRTGRPEQAASLAEPWLARSEGERLWPFVSLAWRLIDDPRSAWLDGDPALIGIHDLADLDLDRLAARLRTLHLAKRDPLGQSVRGGTQTDGPLFAHEAPEIQALRARIVDAVERHIATMGTRDPKHPALRHVGKRFRFAGSWSVRLTGAGHHSNHIHPQGWLSSAFYVALPPQEDMGPAPAGWLGFGGPPTELSLDMAPLRHIEPKPGRLVLFPSTMWHGTMPIAGGERLTVAFDVAAIG
ncbi:2OG-Fe(II) oxygenase family protein [Sphingomonas colocasiae]|uniref:Tetratricopeptide repeat protein n=1 Tax=Sphingomonas colocasiae TaxID=1848973 RepID=A0ABS7PM81_9SPHN|nr:putative 2OG-Fe(II) oxygenase [Sphingomonas colocasiae]MBY8822414.1 tetratricopeptide repeat protein [Sphingomonas colocasiae]